MFTFPLWAVLAFAFSFMGAFIIGYNQWARMDGRHLTLWRYNGVMLAALVALPFVALPLDPFFYATAALMGLALAGSDILLANAANTHGGRLTALYIPLKMFMAFFAWLALDAASRDALLAAPLTAAGVLGCLAACSWSLAHLRRSDASWAALRDILPVAALLAMADIVAKLLLDTPAATMADIVGGAVGWMLASGVVAAAVSACMLRGRGIPLAVTRRGFWQSLVFGVLLLAGIAVLLTSIALAPNPGYVAAITMLSAVWLGIWAFFKKGERTNLMANLMLVASAIALALITH